jgi:hypothetical protein
MRFEDMGHDFLTKANSKVLLNARINAILNFKFKAMIIFQGIYDFFLKIINKIFVSQTSK